MIRSRKRWLFGFIASVGILLAGGISLIVATESGTRWLIRQAAGYLPDELQLGPSEGTLLHGVRIGSIDWRSESLWVSIENLALDIELLPLFARRIAIGELDIEGVDIQFGAAGESGPQDLSAIALPVGVSIAASSIRSLSIRSDRIDRTIDDIRLTGRMDGSDLDIARLDVASTWLNLELAGRARLAGSFPADFQAGWQWTAPEELHLAGELQLKGDLRRYELRHSLTAPISASTTGHIAHESGGLAADLTTEWRALEWLSAGRTIRSSSGSIRLQGSTPSFAVTLSTFAQLDDHPETRIELDGDTDLESIRISRLGAINDLGRLSAAGNANWLPEPSLELEFELSELDPSMVRETVVGAVELAGQVSGQFVGNTPEVDLRIERLGGNINGYPLQGGAEIAYADDTLAVSNGRLQLGSNHASVNGSIGELVSLNADLDLPAIGEILPGTSGSLHGQIEVGGPDVSPDMRVKMTGSALAWMDYSLTTLSADASISSTDRSHAELKLEQFAAGDRVLDSARFSASGRIDEHSLRASVSGYGGVLELDVAGGYLQDRWTGRIDSLTVAADALGRWSTRKQSDLVASADDIALSQTCLFDQSDPGSACFEVDYRKGGGASFDVSMTEVPLSAIPPPLAGDVKLSGSIEARLQGKFKEQRLSGGAEIELQNAVIVAVYDGETVSVAFSDAAGEATIADNRIESTIRLEMTDGAGSGNLKLDIDDFADSLAAIRGRGDVSIRDVSLFSILIPGVTNPRGRIDGALAVSGSLGQPDFAGEVALTDAAFGVRQSGIEISEVDLRLTRRAAGRLQLTGGARSGNGRVSIQGDTQISADTGIRTEFVLSGEDFELARLPDWQIAASPSITVVLDERTASVSGELDIPNANIRIKTVPETAESPSPDATVHRADGASPPPGRRIDIDVGTTFGKEVQFAGFGLTTGIEGTVQLKGGTHAPYIGLGRLTLRDGHYKTYGQELEIERGELIFNGPLDNPSLDIRAVRRATGVIAGIQLSGTPSQLQSELFSEPALSDAEALSYLLTGRPLTSATGDGDALNNAAFALGLSGAGSVASRIRGQLGLETLTVEGGAESGKIVAGKRFGNRLLVEYGYGLIDKLGTLLLRYQLNDRIVLESRTGAVSNLDIVYSVKKQ